MNSSLDELYFEWLYSKVSTLRRRKPEQTHFSLLRIIFKREFVWIIPNDDNRVNDGIDLRNVFLEEENIDTDDYDWLTQGCSMLEMLIGLAYRYSFETSIPYRICFWDMIENLDLHQYNDSVDIPQADVEEKLDNVIWRTYSRNGRGGLFPLEHPRKDQRDVELWYQLSAYIIERQHI